MLNAFRLRHPKLFLSGREVKALSKRIDQFEQATGCELVFHFRNHFEGDPVQDAQKLFLKFGLNKTDHRATVLIVLALQSRALAVWADDNVHRRAGDVLWKEVCDGIAGNIKSGHRLKALMEAIDKAEPVLAREQADDLKNKAKTLSNKPITEEE